MAYPNPRRSTTLDERPAPESEGTPQPEPGDEPQPAPGPAPRPGPQPLLKPPGLRNQIRFTRDAAWRLAMAHIELAKAEAAAIQGEIARVAVYAIVAITVVLLAVILAFVGASLFVGEWLLGSIGWGALHGVLLLIAIAMVCVLSAVGVSGRRIGGAFVVAVVIAVLVGVVLGLGLPNQLYVRIGDAALPGVEPGVRPLVVGVAIWALLGLIGGLIASLGAKNADGRILAIVGGLLFGVVIGAISAVTTGPQVGAGIGIAVGYLIWIGLMALDISRTGVDTEALKARFTPTQTIETSKETLAWLQSKMPPGTGS